jgi:hypothetical protein
MRNQHVTAIMLSFICLTAPAWADFKAGMDAHHRGDYATALHEWPPLAEQGNAAAQSNLGLLYANGHGVLQDYVQARQWWEKAAVQGDEIAMNNLGTNYLNGYGVPQDYKTALFWFRLAADRGNATAQAKLGLMYKNGLGVPQDFIHAHKWYNLAGANGEKFGTESRDQLAERMTPAQIAEAQQLAREWKPKQK